LIDNEIFIHINELTSIYSDYLIVFEIKHSSTMNIFRIIQQIKGDFTMTTTTTDLELYQFDKVEMHLIPATIIPPIYSLTVIGVTGSLNPIIELVTTGNVDAGYVRVEVLGKDRAAIGSMDYKKTINISRFLDTKGVLVKGANGKEVKLDWNAVRGFSEATTVGLFHLTLQSETNFLGSPIIHMSLGVDTVTKNVTGVATVTQAIANPIVCTSHVYGNLINEAVMPPGVSKIRIDLTGYPEIHWPGAGGIGPVLLKNLTAMILFDSNWTNGIVNYQYATASGWVKESQKINIAT
jgi:hypothetical protein